MFLILFRVGLGAQIPREIHKVSVHYTENSAEKKTSLLVPLREGAYRDRVRQGCVEEFFRKPRRKVNPLIEKGNS